MLAQKKIEFGKVLPFNTQRISELKIAKATNSLDDFIKNELEADERDYPYNIKYDSFDNGDIFFNVRIENVCFIFKISAKATDDVYLSYEANYNWIKLSGKDIRYFWIQLLEG